MDPIFAAASSTEIAGDLVALVIAAVVGGYVAHLIRMPLVVGYIVGGLIVGPSVSNLVTDIDDVAFVGELGVALLLFSIGLEFPLEQFRRLGYRLFVAATIQIAVLGLVGYAVASSFGLSDAGATLVAGATAFSSTALLVRLLSEEGSRRRADGRWVLGVALVQDLVAVPLLVVLPQLGEGTGTELMEEILIAAAKGVGLVVAVLVLGPVIVPWVLRRALAVRSRELFLMSVFALASGVALGSFAVGLSLAFGAFLAGLVTAQSVYASRALHELVPLRDLFAATFFVSIGVLLDVGVVGDEWGLFLSILAWGALGKILLIFALARWAHFDYSRALRMGLLLGQVGEFSFLFAEAAAEGPAEEAGSIIIALGAVSMGVSAAIIRFGDRIERVLLRVPRVASRWTFEPEAELPGPALRQHTVIAGYGETGRELARALRRRDFRFLIVDSDPNLPEELGGTETPYIWGDLANPATLDGASLGDARVLALTIPDPVVTEAVVRRVRAEFPRVQIVVRGAGAMSHGRLLAAGAAEVVHPNLEVGLEIARHTLSRYGVPYAEIRMAQAQRRQEYRR